MTVRATLTRVALLAVIVAAAALFYVTAGRAADPTGEPIETGSSYTGPWFRCTSPPTAAGVIVKAHQGRWHAAQLVKQGWTCVQLGVQALSSAASSSPACRIMDAREPVVMVPDAELLSSDPGTRSLANGWQPASLVAGHFACVPVPFPIGWTDDSLSHYDAPNTAYAVPVASW